MAPVRNVATTPDTVNSVSFGSNGVSAGVWQLGTGGWKTLPGGRLDPPSRGPSTKLRLAAFDAPAPAQEVKGSPEPKAEPASPPRQRPASPQHDAPKPQPVVLQPKPRVAPPRAVQQTPVEPARAPAVPVRPIVCQQCNCKNSRCLKQYCVCFARGGLCGPECACANCANNSEDREEVLGPKTPSISSLRSRIPHSPCRLAQWVPMNLGSSLQSPASPESLRPGWCSSNKLASSTSSGRARTSSLDSRG